MTKTAEEVRRAAFLNWWDSLASKWEEESAKVSAWQAFNAALDAVEIQLPDWHSTDGSDSVIDYNEAVAAIEQTGLGLRVK